MRIHTLKKREEFVQIAQRGGKFSTPTLVLQHMSCPSPHSADDVRIGFTVTRKLGNAVVRNRIKRRLREASRKLLPEFAVAGHDYVFIGRSATQHCPYATLLKDMQRALQSAQSKR